MTRSVRRGEEHHAAVLTERRVLAIRRAAWKLAAAGARVSMSGLVVRRADDYGVSYTTVVAALHGVTWSHLPDAYPVDGHSRVRRRAHRRRA